MTPLATSMATAKQMDCACGMMAVLTPMTSPRELSSGPPEFPGFRAASVCRTSGISLPVDERMVRVVEMKYFAGLNEQEIAAAMGVTERTVRRDWQKARLLLAAALG